MRYPPTLPPPPPLRKLVEGLGLSGLPFKRVHLWPKKFEGCVGGGVGGELPAHSVAYFVGLEVDQRRSKEGAVLDVDKVRACAPVFVIIVLLCFGWLFAWLVG